VTAPTRGLITTDNARAMADRKKELIYQRTIEGIENAFETPGDLRGTGWAWAKLIEHTARTYASSENLRGMGEVLSKLGMYAGFNTAADIIEDNAAPGPNTQGAEIVRNLLQIIQEVNKAYDHKDNDAPIIIDAEGKEQR
jgi:hypothetical protein